MTDRQKNILAEMRDTRIKMNDSFGRRNDILEKAVNGEKKVANSIGQVMRNMSMYYKFVVLPVSLTLLYILIDQIVTYNTILNQ